MQQPSSRDSQVAELRQDLYESTHHVESTLDYIVNNIKGISAMVTADAGQIAVY
jgi:hypothetical protein